MHLELRFKKYSLLQKPYHISPLTIESLERTLLHRTSSQIAYPMRQHINNKKHV